MWRKSSDKAFILVKVLMALFIFIPILKASITCLYSLKRYSQAYLKSTEAFYEGSLLDDFLEKEINKSNEIIKLNKNIIFYKKEDKADEENNHNYSTYILDKNLVYRQSINSERELSHEELERFFNYYRTGRNLISKDIEYFNIYIKDNLLVLEFKQFSNNSYKRTYDISYKLKNREGLEWIEDTLT